MCVFVFAQRVLLGALWQWFSFLRYEAGFLTVCGCMLVVASGQSVQLTVRACVCGVCGCVVSWHGIVFAPFSHVLSEYAVRLDAKVRPVSELG